MPPKKRKIILLTAGGTGGHFFPAVALAEELAKNLELEVHISTDNRCKKYLTNDINIKSHIVDLYINLRGIINKLKIPFSIYLSLIKAFILIKKLKPKLIIGFGGYPSFPLMFIGQLLSIPTIVYEQNSFFGKSNKFFTKKAILIALAYKSTQNLPTNYSDKILIIGDFVRDKIKNLPEKSSFSNKPFNLLVFGGSQGAKIFSSLVPEAIKILLTKYPETEIRIVQQVLENDKERVKKAYDNLKIQSTLSDFFHDIYKQYENSHLVIARAGATTIAELTQIGLPAIFIPLPSSADDHQYYNAKSLQDSNCSWYYRQEEVTAEVLADKLHSLIDTPSIIKEASLNLLKRKTDGTKHLANTVLKIIT